MALHKGISKWGNWALYFRNTYEKWKRHKWQKVAISPGKGYIYNQSVPRNWILWYISNWGKTQ